MNHTSCTQVQELPIKLLYGDNQEGTLLHFCIEHFTYSIAVLYKVLLKPGSSDT